MAHPVCFTGNSKPAPKIMDTNDLEKAIDASLDKTMSEDSSSLQVNDNPGQPEPTKVEESPAPEATAGKEAPAAPEVKETKPEEQFTKLDLSTLTPEGKQIYDKLSKDYVWATQRIANRYLPTIESKDKEIAELKQKLEQPAKPAEDLSQLSEEERIERIVSEREEKNWTEMQEQEFLSADPRFNENTPEFEQDKGATFLYVTGKLLPEADQWKAEHGSYKGFNYVKRAKELVTEFDTYVEGVVQRRMAAQTESSRTKMIEDKKRNPNGTFTSSAPIKGKMSVDDAINAALTNI